MLAALDETIKRLLIRELPIANGEVEISFDQPKREWVSGRGKPRLNFYLYDVVENTELRRNDWLVERNGGQAAKHKPALRFDVTYVVTAWASAVDDEHKLLWRALAVLTRYPTLPEAALVDKLQDVDAASLQARVLGAEDVPELGDLWNVVDADLRPALHYRVTLPLDVAQRFVGPLVFTKQLRLEADVEGAGPFEELWQIAGSVRDAKGQPLVGAEVRAEEVGRSIRTDLAGHYTFSNLPPGEYTFTVTIEGGKPKKHKIKVPSEQYDLTV